MADGQKSLPQAVQNLIDDADKLEAGLLADDAPDSQDSPPPEPEPTGSNPDDSLGDDPPAQPGDDQTAEIDRLKRDLQAALVEQGRVRSLTQQLRQANERIDDLGNKLEQAQKKQPDPNSVQIPSGQRDDLVEAYGEELVSYMENFAKAQVGELRSEVTKVSNVAGQVSQVQQQSAKITFWEKVNAAHPDWQSVQATQPGQSFLGTVVPYQNGRTFNDLLQDAATALDARTVIDVFNSMKDAIKKAGSPQDRVHKQVVPGKGPVGTPQQQNQKPTLSMVDVKNAATQYAKIGDMSIPHKYGAKTLDEWDAMVNEAALEGRLQ